MMVSWWIPILVVWFTSLERTLIRTFPYCSELEGLNDIRRCDQPTLALLIGADGSLRGKLLTDGLEAKRRSWARARRLPACRQLVSDLTTNACGETFSVRRQKRANRMLISLCELTERPRHCLNHHLVSIVE
jgi:hypothetical protein